MRPRLPYVLAGIALVALLGVVAMLGVVVATDDEPEAVVVAPGLGMSAGFGGMMDGMSGAFGTTTVKPVDTMADAARRVDAWLEESGFESMSAAEVMAFSSGYYVAVESDEGRGAFELIVDPATGWITPEPGPNMMWNTEYGMMQGRYGGGMMGDGMMGGGMLGETVLPGGDGDLISAEQAEELANDWLTRVLPGESAGEPRDFPGYYTLDTERDGRPSGMLSVNAATGAVWYHAWHGSFFDELEL